MGRNNFTIPISDKLLAILNTFQDPRAEARKILCDVLTTPYKNNVDSKLALYRQNQLLDDFEKRIATIKKEMDDWLLSLKGSDYGLSRVPYRNDNFDWMRRERTAFEVMYEDTQGRYAEGSWESDHGEIPPLDHSCYANDPPIETPEAQHLRDKVHSFEVAIETLQKELTTLKAKFHADSISNGQEDYNI